MATAPLVPRRSHRRRGDTAPTTYVGWDLAQGPPRPHTLSSSYPIDLWSGYSWDDDAWPDTTTVVTYFVDEEPEA